MMATSATIRLDPNVHTEFRVPQITASSAEKVSTLLQKNHEYHDIFFNDIGFHNHIVHHLLTAFALGASAETLQKHYDNNLSYQRQLPPEGTGVVRELSDYGAFLRNLEKEENYKNYLVFFTQQLKDAPYSEVLNEFVFKGDERANIMFNRLFAGIMHPVIHLGFGVEFEQPAIIAEALAQAAIHQGWLDQYFIAADEAAKEQRHPARSLVSIVDMIHADKKLSSAAHWDDNGKIRNGILVRANDEMIKYASMWRVRPEYVERAEAEMTNAATYFTGGAQHPPKQVKFDFFYIHSVNCSIFISSLMNQPWVSKANKAKLLEWKGRLDLALYASEGAAKPLMDEIKDYQPKLAAQDWPALINRAKLFEDDGHGSKFVRAIAHGQRICKPYEDSDDFRIKGDMWLQLGNMAIDSVEDDGAVWVRSAGFDEAWKNYKNRPTSRI